MRVAPGEMKGKDGWGGGSGVYPPSRNIHPPPLNSAAPRQGKDEGGGGRGEGQ